MQSAITKDLIEYANRQYPAGDGRLDALGSQVNIGHCTATIDRATHHWVWKTMSLSDGVPAK